jgi:hypothetical protein
MKKISIVASLLLVSSSIALADSASVKEAFANGKASGDITIFSENKDVKSGTNTGYTTGSISLSYETDVVNGFSAKVGFKGNTEIDEKNNGDYAFAEDTSVTEANIKYVYDKATVIAGRQEIDLEWLGDYNDGVVGIIDYIPNTSLVLGYSNRKAEIDNDTHDKFTDIGEDGAYVIDAKFSGIENVVINPYYYTVPDIADFYGMKVTYDTEMFGLTAQYAETDEDVSTTKDGEIYNLEGRLNISDFAFAVGYIKTDKTGGIGSMAAAGDNINPFDDGENVYGTDAKTTYGSIGYTIGDLGLTALYGNTEYAANSETDELNLIVDYSFTSELSANLTYVDYDDQGSASDYNKILASVTYAF